MCIRDSDFFVGVVIFSRGASSNLLNPYGLKQTQGCELTRVALRSHQTPVSKILSFAIKFLKNRSKNLRIIVSFADPHYGHHGGIYQAGNWIYVGDTVIGKEYWLNGRRLHSRQVSEKGWNIQQGVKRKTIRPSECVVRRTAGKHKYIMPLDSEMRVKVLPLAKPYPKRVGGVDSDTPAIHAGEGGASPTSTLHINELQQ